MRTSVCASWLLKNNPMPKSIDELKQAVPGAENDPELVAISDDLDLAEELAYFINTPAGKSTVAKLRSASMNALNEVFEVSRKGELPPLLGAVARLEQSIAMLRRFLGAKSDADALLELLKEKAAKI